MYHQQNMDEVWQNWIESFGRRREPAERENSQDGRPLEVLSAPSNLGLNPVHNSHRIWSMSALGLQAELGDRQITSKNSLIHPSRTDKQFLTTSIIAQGTSQTLGPRPIFFMPSISIVQRIFVNHTDLLFAVNDAVMASDYPVYRRHRYRLDRTNGLVLKCSKCSSFIRAQFIPGAGFKVVQFDSRHELKKKKSRNVRRFLKDRRRRMVQFQLRREAQLDRQCFQESWSSEVQPPLMFYSDGSQEVSSIHPKQPKKVVECDNIRAMSRLLFEQDTESREYNKVPKKKGKKKNQGGYVPWATVMQLMSKKK